MQLAPTLSNKDRKLLDPIPAPSLLERIKPSDYSTEDGIISIHMGSVFQQKVKLTSTGAALRIYRFFCCSDRIRFARHTEGAEDMIGAAELRGKGISWTTKAVTKWISALNYIALLKEMTFRLRLLSLGSSMP